MKNINLLFDASVIFQYIHLKGSGRSGIFWAAYNILYHLSLNPLFQITLLVPFNLFSFNKRKIPGFKSSFHTIKVFNIRKYEINIEENKSYIKHCKNIFILLIKYLKLLKNFTLLLFSKIIPIAHKDFDLFITPSFSMIDVNKYFNIKKIQILHDCIPFISNNNSPWFTKIIDDLNKETYYFCNSSCTKSDFLKFFPEKLDESKLFIIPHASSRTFFPNYDKSILQKTLKKYGITYNQNDNYIFSLCSIDPRKNLIFTIKCFIKFIKKHEIKNLYFYMGGGYFKNYIEQFKQEISNFNEYNKKIILLGYIDDDDVNILYSNSLFFTFLSQYEGFGVPPLEAMQAGTPVICSNNSSLPEVVGDASVTIAYDDEISCIKTFEDLYFNEPLRNHYIEKGIERVKLFSWKKTVNKMTEVITSIVS